MIHIARWLLLLLALTPALARAQTFPVWPHVAPGSAHWPRHEVTVHDSTFGTVVFNVATPTLTAYLPTRATATGAAVIIAPGGSFRGVTVGLEGENVAASFQRRGIAAFVLRYRVLDHHRAENAHLSIDSAGQYAIADGIQALKTVRRRAAEWHLDPRRIGIIGFSAGGMLASNVLMQADASARPAFTILVYGAPFGDMPRVPPALPPTLMVWARDDGIAAQAMVRFRDALRAAGNRPDVLVYDHGGHGFGMSHRGTDSDRWMEGMYGWLGSAMGARGR